jgi:hypothetical protein
MFLASPIWLILLAPWAGLLIWLLRGRFETRGVPFLELWGREAAQNRKPDRAWRMPPMAVVALLAAMLLGILAAAGPMIWKNDLPVSISSSDVRIESLAVRTVPTTQAMIRLLNESNLASAKLTVRAGSAVVTEDVDLPGREQSRNYFVDVPVAASTIDAEVLSGKIDHHLQTAQQVASPIVEARGPLPPELSRIIEVYSRHRAPGEESKHIEVITASANVISDEPAAVLMNPRSGVREPSSIRPLIVHDSPLTRSVDWDRVLLGANMESPPSGDWQPIVSSAGVVAVACREEPVKQVWVGFNSEEFGHQADFVIFWSNVFNWLGDGGEDYHAVAPAALVTGLFPVAAREQAVPVARWALFIALGMMILSALTWKAPRVIHGVIHAKSFQS